MTNDQLKTIWQADINTKERYDAAYQQTRRYLPQMQDLRSLLPQRDGIQMAYLDMPLAEAWPLQRDLIREAIGVYPEATSVVKWMRSREACMGQYFVHISPVNPMEVAFTIDRQNALADRKVRQPIGRVLRKFFMYMPDAEVQRLEQQHRAELDTTFKLADTVEAIERVYIGMDGDSGCMRYERGNFHHTDYHPSAVYASAGMGVAYTEDEDGHGEIPQRGLGESRQARGQALCAHLRRPGAEEEAGSQRLPDARTRGCEAERSCATVRSTATAIRSRWSSCPGSIRRAASMHATPTARWTASMRSASRASRRSRS